MCICIAYMRVYTYVHSLIYDFFFPDQKHNGGGAARASTRRHGPFRLCRMQGDVCVCVSVCLCVKYTYVYIYIYIHTHTRMHKCIYVHDANTYVYISTEPSMPKLLIRQHEGAVCVCKHTHTHILPFRM